MEVLANSPIDRHTVCNQLSRLIEARGYYMERFALPYSPIVRAVSTRTPRLVEQFTNMEVLANSPISDA